MKTETMCMFCSQPIYRSNGWRHFDTKKIYCASARKAAPTPLGPQCKSPNEFPTKLSADTAPTGVSDARDNQGD